MDTERGKQSGLTSTAWGIGMEYEIKVNKTAGEIVPEEGECPLLLDYCLKDQECEFYGGMSSSNTIRCLFFKIDKEGNVVKTTGNLLIEKGEK